MAVTVGAGARQRFGQQSAAATDVEHARAAQRRALLHVARTHGIEPVQWFELAVDIPEAMRGGLEFGDFRGVAFVRMMGRIGASMRAGIIARASAAEWSKTRVKTGISV